MRRNIYGKFWVTGMKGNSGARDCSVTGSAWEGVVQEDWWGEGGEGTHLNQSRRRVSSDVQTGPCHRR